MKASPLVQFMKRVTIDPATECWLWSSATTTGYGRFQRDGATAFAHRVSYELFRGEIPAGMHVCHKCDVRRCVNPYHLFVGTQRDNIQDCANKGRFRGLISVDKIKLTNDQVVEIAGLYGAVTQPALALRYGVSLRTIARIMRARHRHDA